MTDFGVACGPNQDCTQHNIHCGYPRCFKGRLEKEREGVAELSFELEREGYAEGNLDLEVAASSHLAEVIVEEQDAAIKFFSEEWVRENILNRPRPPAPERTPEDAGRTEAIRQEILALKRERRTPTDRVAELGGRND